MTWFRIDDGLHKHRKRIRAGLTMEGFAALGLWTIAGSWSSDELTDGWIPDDVVDYLAPGIGQQLAERLEYAGLWERVTRDGEKGWQFHDWTDHQPTREQVLAERAAAALRQKRARERAKERRDKEGQEGQEQAASRRDSRVTNAETHGGVTPAVTVPPTRPDPTRPIEEPPSEVLFGNTEPSKPAKKPRTTKAATRIPDDFTVTPEMVAWASEKTPLVNVERETDQFKDYWQAATRNATKRDWEAAWRTWMRNAQQRAEERETNRHHHYQQNRRPSPSSGYPDRNGVIVRDMKPQTVPAEVRKAQGWLDLPITEGGTLR